MGGKVILRMATHASWLRNIYDFVSGAPQTKFCCGDRVRYKSIKGWSISTEPAIIIEIKKDPSYLRRYNKWKGGEFVIETHMGARLSTIYKSEELKHVKSRKVQPKEFTRTPEKTQASRRCECGLEKCICHKKMNFKEAMEALGLKKHVRDYRAWQEALNGNETIPPKSSKRRSKRKRPTNERTVSERLYETQILEQFRESKIPAGSPGDLQIDVTSPEAQARQALNMYFQALNSRSSVANLKQEVEECLAFCKNVRDLKYNEDADAFYQLVYLAACKQITEGEFPSWVKKNASLANMH